MRKKILLPTDFSDNAWNAIVYALELYKYDACDFYLLNAFTTPLYTTDSLFMSESTDTRYNVFKQQSEDGLTEIIDKIASKNEYHHFSKLAVFDTPLNAIKKAVEDNDIELIVMGTRGKPNLTSIVYGSVAVTVMEKIRNCPTLVVPEKAVYDSLNNIVFPTSYKTHFKKRELNFLSRVAEKSSANIRVLHIAKEASLDENQLKHKEMLNDYFENVIHTFHTLENIDIRTGINSFVESRKINLIAFINKKHTFLETILSKPLVKGITCHSKIPVLVLHDLRN